MGYTRVVTVAILSNDSRRRRQLSRALRRDRRIAVTATSGDLVSLYRDAKSRGKPHLLLVDCESEAMECGEWWVLLRGVIDPYVRVVALTSGNDLSLLRTLMLAGVAALHPPNIKAGMLRDAIHKAGNGIPSSDPILLQKAWALLCGGQSPEATLRPRPVADVLQPTCDQVRRELVLTGLEVKLLAHLASCRGRPVPMDDLMTSVWGSPFAHGGTPDQVYSCIRRLRRKIEPDPGHPQYIVSVWGVGYMMAAWPLLSLDSSRLLDAIPTPDALDRD